MRCWPTSRRGTACRRSIRCGPASAPSSTGLTRLPVRRLSIAVESWPIAGRFTISRGSKTEAVTLTVRLEEGAHAGRGECVPYARYGETVEGVAGAIEALRPRLEAGLGR